MYLKTLGILLEGTKEEERKTRELLWCDEDD
jgi:hypothetical protein